MVSITPGSPASPKFTLYVRTVTYGWPRGDDKRFLLVRVQMNDEIPRFELSRLRREDGARYFGPFANANALRSSLSPHALITRYCAYYDGEEYALYQTGVYIFILQSLPCHLHVHCVRYIEFVNTYQVPSEPSYHIGVKG